ncbi:DNA repair protein RadA [Roseisolibacter sp. H3M3-2]|uniref:DNA repair protein RadA n=1 Tax=Roseisolibacter sp. H3M3-2 TaxID=3031323 RepID=UPI0023DC2A5C|nr:DNA repair protein RadA [Roseisolibacter sp. H3M3-2]MDF1501495.1 DNA repair protein RadA [Roseisolibacter sp. H3M3-2]
MAKTKTVYRCTDCGADYSKWQGRCDTCGGWNTLVEEAAAPKIAAKGAGSARRMGGSATLGEGGSVAAAPRLRDVSGSERERWTTGLQEFDFVLGGGIVPGSMVLVGGEPGIGKSTLLLQIAARLQQTGRSTLYVSGEESPLQVKLRADRLDEPAGDVALLSETLLETMIATGTASAPDLMIVDSIQTVFTQDLEGAPGNVGQVRECAARLMRFAKETGTATFVVGHVTKGGGIAGPKTLEHIVDTVLYFEGESTLDHRVLRATKNRFGSVDEIGVFRMTQGGLVAVENPSELFLGDREHAASGSAVTALMEGTRPVLVEIQGLAAKAGFGTPQRVATGYDGRRLALLLAVLDKRAGLNFAQLDVFLNVVGGMRLQEPAGDLAVAAALASSVYDRALPREAVFLGEVGLGGEIRPVSQTERRLAEAAKMGMTVAYVAERGVPRRAPAGIRAVGVRTVRDLFERIFS